LRDVRAGERDIGRNLHAVARAYVPGRTGHVVVTALANNYVIAIPSTEPVTDYGITNTGVNLRNANACDLPISPIYPGDYIEPVLDFYLKNEQYKNDYNDKLASGFGTCTGFNSSSGAVNYSDSWDTYEAAVENFKIAPYVGYTGAGTSVTFRNMAPGSYNFYRIAAPAYGQLFLSAAFVQIGTTREVTEGSTITVP